MAYQLISYTKDGVPLADIENVGNIRCATVFGKSGTLVFELPVTHPKANDFYLKRHNLVAYFDSNLLPWVGYLTNPAWSGGRMITYHVTQVHQMLGRRRTDVVQYDESAPGEAFADLINRANQHGHTGIHVGDVFRGGKPYSASIHRENVYDKVQDLISNTGLEWELEYINVGTHLAHLREKIGADLTDKVVVTGGFDTASPLDYEEQMSDYANSITGVGKLPDGEVVPEGEDEYDYRPYVTVSYQPGIDEFGLSEDTTEYADLEDEDTIREAINKDLDRRARAKRILNCSITNRSALWNQFRDGDIITVYQPYYAYTGIYVPVRVLGREVDPKNDIMTLAVETVDGERAQTLAIARTALYGSAGNKQIYNPPTDAL